MAATHRAPKQWCLTKAETVNSYESWRHNIIYTLSLDPNFSTFLDEEFHFMKKTKTTPLRGLNDDGEDVAADKRLTAVQKNASLELMLGQIANYCPVISRNTIVKNSTSINDIWQAIRLHYGFQSTGGHILDLSAIRLEADERPEDLYQRIVAFIEDNLLQQGGGITHHGQAVTDDEELSPTLENVIVVTWLQLIHPELPRLVRQRYGTELRSRSLASIKPEISQALNSLLEELQSAESARSMRTYSGPQLKPPRRLPPRTTKPRKTCPLCKQVGRPNTQHFLSECKFLPEHDRKYIARARQISEIYDNDDADEDLTCAFVEEELEPAPDSLPTNRIQIRQSPFLDTFYRHHNIRVTIDSGATGNMIRESTATAMGVKITKSTQAAHQADGSSPLSIKGETTFVLTRDGHQLTFDGLVVEKLDVALLGGTPFMEANDIAVRPAKHQVIMKDGTFYAYGTRESSHNQHAIRRAHVLRAPSKMTTLWPGDYLEVELPSTIAEADPELALEPRVDTFSARVSKAVWPSPCILRSVSGKIRIPNLTDEPLILKRHEQFGQVCHVFSPPTPVDLPNVQTLPAKASIANTRQVHSKITHSTAVQLDPDNMLPNTTQDKFRSLHDEYDDVFNPSFPGYNGKAGPFQAVVNMGPVQPPQRKGRTPQYSTDKLEELQHKFDELEELGVFARPEAVGVNVEYLNPSFLIKKASGGYRLVTAFADVGRYSKPQPSLMPDVNSTLRSIAKWKFLIATDLTSAFYQIPLSRQSMKYCGVATPFRGTFVYTRSAMGMPGSETALEELMCRVLGDLLEKGVVAKMADDLYCGGNTIDELYNNWRSVLQALYNSNLRLSAKKTIICPKTTVILGWIWSNGTLQASPHRVSTLSTCTPPDTVRGLRSFIGAYKFLARVLPKCSSFMSPLDDVVSGCPSREKINWTDHLQDAYKSAQAALTSNRTVTLPRPEDQIWIITDGSVKMHSIGATMYISRNSKLHLAGFFSAKLRGRQPTWLPCEVEALAISSAIKHFSPYIIQSKHHACVLTDSKPCVQAFEKLCRGEFSASPRVATFLSTVSRYQASIRHLAGTANIPSDFASRNAPDCLNPTCQICSFIQRDEESTVLRTSIPDVISGKDRTPFTSRNAWSAVQLECPDLRRAHAHLMQGTRPSKKLTNIKDVKRYLNAVTIAKDGLLVVRREQPLAPPRECIVVPRQVLNGLLTALHIQLDHPTRHQLSSVTNRSFYGLDMDKAINQVTTCCHHCASLRTTPHMKITQSTSDPPESVGISFAADVIKRNRQLILVVRENVTSLTASCFIESERHDILRDALIRLCVDLRPLDGPPAVIRTDPAPGFVRLVHDELLKRHRISIEIGRVKNRNKNPIAEKAVRELEDELLRQQPMGGPVTSLVLSLATSSLNTRIRSRGLSSREMWSQRDQFSNQQIPFSDIQMIQSQHQLRSANHPYSEKSKAPNSSAAPITPVEVGDIVYLYSDHSKLRARNRYLVTSVDSMWCNIRTFTGSQLRARSYRIKRSECYKVPSQWEHSIHRRQSPETDDSDIVDEPTIAPPVPPGIPAVLSTPASLSETPAGTYTGPNMVPAIPTRTPTDTSEHESTPACQDPWISEPPPPPDLTCESIAPRRSLRQRNPPKHFNDYVCESLPTTGQLSANGAK